MKNKAKKPFNRARFYRFLAFLVPGTAIATYLALSIYGAVAFTTVPNRQLGRETPAKFGLNYEEIAFPEASNDNITLRGWLIPNPKSERVIIMVHGQNANRIEHLDLDKLLWDRGYSILAFDMRGHGLSDGDSHSLGLHEQWDVVGAANFLKNKGFKPGQIGIMGWSMGAATTIMGMSQTPDIKAGVSDSGYADLSSMYGLLYPGMALINRLFRGLDLDQVKPEDSIRRLGGRHLFIIHGDNDSNVPVSNAYRLKEAGGSSVTDFWILPGVSHIGAFYAVPDEYLRRVTAFFEREL